MVNAPPVKHSPTASTSKSSVERSQCSPKVVHPIATTATRSRIPLLAIGFLHQASLPEVVVHATRGVHTAEGQPDPAADGHLVGFRVGQLQQAASAPVEIHHRVDHRRG